jgi:hypothetical protein
MADKGQGGHLITLGTNAIRYTTTNKFRSS